MMQQPQQQQPSFQQRRHKKNRLAAAFALQSRGHSLEDQSAFVPAEINQQQQNMISSFKEACPVPEQQQQQQVEDDQQQQQKHEAIAFLEEHGVPTFVPVFETVEAIEPKCNESLRGQVPWKCAFCHSHSFGHHCMTCVRHRDAAALRIFVGQLCKEGTQQVVQKMVEVLCPKLSAPCIFVEPHTDATTGRGKGCAWIYVQAIEDIPYVVKCLNKRTFVTVDENSGNVGFVAFPSSFSNHEIEEAFQIDHDAQTPELQSLFLFTCIAAQVPKAFHSWGLLGAKKTTTTQMMTSTRYNNNNIQQRQQQQQQQVPPPPPPTYGSSLPPPPSFTPVVKPQTQQITIIDNRQFEEQEMIMLNLVNKKPTTTATVSPSSSVSSKINSNNTPKVFLGNEPSSHFTCPVPQQQQQQQQTGVVVQASWINNTQDDDNYFAQQRQQQQQSNAVYFNQYSHQHQQQYSYQQQGQPQQQGFNAGAYTHQRVSSYQHNPYQQ